MIRIGALFLAGLAALGNPLAAQHHPHGPGPVSPLALRQIRELEQAVVPLATAEGARAAGYGPVLGWIATMGTHWVSPARMLSPRRFDSAAPPQLMFSPIGGRDSLVGAAYAYLASETDTTRPASFDGDPPWHEHPDLAPPGMTLVMLHVWFVESPDGPFAGHNPWLPFWALRLNPPDPARLRDPEAGPRIRAAALALGEVVDSAGPFPRLARRLSLQGALAPHREAIRTLVPLLAQAQKANDQDAWDRAAGKLAGHWREIREIYLGAVQRPEFRERMEKFLKEMETGGH